MSIIQSLKRLFDPIEYRREHQERKRKAETRHSEEQPDDPSAGRERWRCRLCGYEENARYCLRCLAETMERQRFHK
jgi:rubrerythrin